MVAKTVVAAAWVASTIKTKRKECPQREGRKEGRRSGAFNLPRVFEM
jgi:hypothetical protein